jgi:hypothetical protein
MIAHHGKALLSVVIIAGSPCQGFSRAKKNGQGIDDVESSKMWIVPAAHSHLQALVGHVNVGLILENVVMRSGACFFGPSSNSCADQGRGEVPMLQVSSYLD